MDREYLNKYTLQMLATNTQAELVWHYVDNTCNVKSLLVLVVLKYESEKRAVVETRIQERI